MRDIMEIARDLADAVRFRDAVRLRLEELEKDVQRLVEELTAANDKA